jgi:hypothetical protein
MHLLGYVMLEVRSETCSDRIARRELACAFEGCLHERHHRPRDVIRDDEAAGEELVRARTAQQVVERRAVRGQCDLGLAAEALARRQR